MFKKQIPDKALVKKMNQRLGRAGVSGCKITLTVRSGYVTLAGELQYEHQRRAIMNAARGVEGVRGVTDGLTVKAKVKNWC